MISRFVPVLLIAACASTPVSNLPPAPAADRIAAECALLAEAAQRDPGLHAGLREGCPGVAARDTRPLAAQIASLRAANAAALPSGVPQGTRAETVFRRLITRGVSPSMAAELTTRPEFALAARRGDAR